MVLAADTPIKLLEGDFADYPVAASERIFEGALVTIDATTGLLKNLDASPTAYATTRPVLPAP